MVVPIGFTCENLETVYEIDLEYIRDLAEGIYDRVERVPCPDAHPDFVEVLADVVARNVESGEFKTANLKLRCPDCKFDICHHLGKC